MNYAQWKATLAGALDPAVERSQAVAQLSKLAQQEDQVRNAMSGFREFVERSAVPLGPEDMKLLRDHFLSQLRSLDILSLGILEDLLTMPRLPLTEEARQVLREFVGKRRQSLPVPA